MAASFRSRVFRLLLLFAVVPSIVLTVIGYYLATNQAPMPVSESGASTSELRDYFYDRLYRDIRLTLEEGLEPDSSADASLDFLLEVDSAGKSTRPEALPPEARERILAEIPAVDQGVVEVDGKFYQFVAKSVAGSAYLVGGIIHDSTLANTLNAATSDQSTSDTARELRATYVLFLGLLFLIVILITIAAAYYFSSRVSRNLAEPVAALSRASSLIAAGDFKQDIKIVASGEIGALINNFNRMASRLDEVSSRLMQTERVAAWRQVARRFAHELKNPLQPIIVSLYRLEQKLATTELWEQLEEPMRATREEVQHLAELADRFSTLAKLPPPSIKPCELIGLVESTVALYRDKLKPFDFRLELPEQPVNVETDAGFVREAVHNLIQNAIDACRSGDNIVVALKALTDRVELSVKDSGPGMNPQTLAAARLPYFTTKAQGNGLGLAIVERSMAELGGRLQVESVEGKGTVVRLILPGGTK